MGKERTSSHNHISAKADRIDDVARYKFCPPDLPYLPAIRKFFGKGPDWKHVRGDGITLEEEGVKRIQ